jgi:hypothetical protein
VATLSKSHRPCRSCRQPTPRRSADGWPVCADCAGRPLSESWHYRRRPKAIADGKVSEEVPRGCVRTAAGLVVEAREVDPAAEAAERKRRVELYARRWAELEARGQQRTVLQPVDGIG